MKLSVKKIVASALALAMVASTAAFAANSPVAGNEAKDAKDVTVGNSTVTTKADGTATVTKVNNKKSVTIDTTVDGVSYSTTIAAKAIGNKTKTVTVKASKVTINKNAFKSAKKIKSIKLTNVKSAKNLTVKKGAFKGVNTKKVTITVNSKTSKKQLKAIKKALKKAGFKGKVVKAKK